MAELDGKVVVKGRDEISHANLAQRLIVSLVLKAAILLQLVKTAWERSLNPAHLSDCLFLEVL